MDASRELTLGVIALTPFHAPASLVTCEFAAGTADTPVASDFVVTIDDATDTNGSAISVAVGVSVTTTP